jgi:hypothetical protein
MGYVDATNFRGALRILGKDDRGVIERIDSLIGGVILASGLVAFVGPAAAPLAAIWGWVDQKNEAVALLRKIANKAVDRRTGMTGHQRTELIAAAHTVLVVSSTMEVISERFGVRKLKQLKLTDREKRYLATGQDAVDTLYATEVPMPSPACGFRENVKRINEFQAQIVARIVRFLDGLEEVRTEDLVLIELRAAAAERYESRYYELAAKVPEFMVWALLGAEDASRLLARSHHEELRAALRQQSVAFSKLESILASIGAATAVGSTQRDLAEVVRRSAVTELSEPVVSRSSSDAGLWSDIVFPAVGESYVEPSYRIAAYDRKTAVAHESWWEDRPVNSDLDVRLTAYLSSPEARQRPLLLLGHPGSGKSILTRVLAARLPIALYTGIHVPLRHVTADAPIHRQIQEALDRSTSGRVDWHLLADQTVDTLRVVMLDGLDELLQATEHNRSAFLHEVAEFQRREAGQQRPVAVIVTSRSVVADRVQIEAGTAVVKLEGFDDGQIETWRRTWNRVNEEGVAAGLVSPLSLEAVRASGSLARQPLLLLLIALYSADPGTTPIESGLSDTMLYRRLIENFARREVERPHHLGPGLPYELVGTHIRRLSVAALAMFNRGRQHVMDVELGADLMALGLSRSGHPEVVGDELVAQFFFIHTSQTKLGDHQARRSYEFLHATFGEYLVAREIVEVLQELGRSFAGNLRNREPDDSLFFALLSHRCLADRRSILGFVSDILQDLTGVERAEFVRLLEVLVSLHRSRHGSDKYATYRPVPLDHIRETAAYSANLVLLRLLCLDGSSPMPDQWLGGVDHPRWRSTLALWQAGLDDGGWDSLLSVLLRDGNVLKIRDSPVQLSVRQLAEAELLGDRHHLRTLQLGVEIRGHERYAKLLDSDSKEEIARWLISVLSLGTPTITEMSVNKFESAIARLQGDLSGLEDLLSEFLEHHAKTIDGSLLVAIVKATLASSTGSLYGVFMALVQQPWLPREVPEIVNPANYVSTDAMKILTYRSEQRRRNLQEPPGFPAFYDAVEAHWRGQHMVSKPVWPAEEHPEDDLSAG